MKKQYTNFRATLFIGLLSVGILSSCANTRQAVGIGIGNIGFSDCMPRSLKDNNYYKINPRNLCFATLLFGGAVTAVTFLTLHHFGGHGPLSPSNTTDLSGNGSMPIMHNGSISITTLEPDMPNSTESIATTLGFTSLATTESSYETSISTSDSPPFGDNSSTPEEHSSAVTTTTSEEALATDESGVSNGAS